MRKRIAIYGITDEALALVPLLEANPDIEIVLIFDPALESALDRAAAAGRETRARFSDRLRDDSEAFHQSLDAVIDAGSLAPFNQTHPEVTRRGLQLVSPLTARLLWGYGVSARDRKGELLQALHEVVESVNLTVDPDELFSRMLEIAMGVTGADGGSLMLVDTERSDLAIRVAIGVEPELWPKIRVPLGEGISGRAAALARPIRLRGKADRESFHILRERMDIESALCVPLVHAGTVMGVLNLHHSSRADAFDDDDLEFAEQLGRLDAEIIARAQEHEALRTQASRYAAVAEVRDALAGAGPLIERLESLCKLVAARVGDGIATTYLFDPGEGELRLAATSLPGGGLGGEYRIVLGQGVDGRVAQTRAPSFLRASQDELDYAALPLLAGTDLVGVLSVQAGRDASGASLEGRAIEETLLEIAAAAADEIAQAEREARMSARATKASAINEAGIRLVSAREPSDVTRLATSSGALILEADHAVLRLQDPETRRYVIRSYYGSADGRTQEALFRLDKQLSVDVIKGRVSRLIRNLENEPSTAALAGGFRSALAAPLKRDGQVIGTLTLFDKVAADQFYAGSFNDDDLQIFNKYVSYVERALTNALYYASSRQHRNFDEETGLPNEDYLARRIDQEITRSAGRQGSLALVTCRIENLDEVRRASDGAQAARLVQRAAESLRGVLREFDVLARIGDDEFAALLPDPGEAPDERVTQLARSVADEIAKDESLNEPVRVALAFGYAIHPSDGTDRAALLARAGNPRIRMV